MADLIDRQAAIDAIDKHCDVICQYSKKQRSIMCGACPLGSAFDVIEGLPSAQPEQKVGKWMHDREDELYSGYCSCCGWTAVIMETDVADMPYCPNCGAKMEEQDG